MQSKIFNAGQEMQSILLLIAWQQGRGIGDDDMFADGVSQHQQTGLRLVLLGEGLQDALTKTNHQVKNIGGPILDPNLI